MSNKTKADIKRDFLGQEINVGDFACCSSSNSSTGMYIGRVTKLTEHKVQLTALDGKNHMKGFNKVFIVTAQIDTIPEMLI